MKKTAVMLILLVFVCSSAMGGLCIMNSAGLSAGVGDGTDCPTTYIVKLDLCSQGHASSSAQSVEAMSIATCLTCYYYPSVKVFPPSPAKAQAKACPGEIEKPPKA